MTPPTMDAEGGPLPEGVRVAVFPAEASCLGPPLADVPLGEVVRLPREAGAYDVAAWYGRQLGDAKRIALPAWTPPPPGPPPPLAFRTPTGAVELTWLPPEAPTTVTIVERDGVELGRFTAETALLTDLPPTPAPAPRYRIRQQGDDFRTPWSTPVEVP